MDTAQSECDEARRELKTLKGEKSEVENKLGMVTSELEAAKQKLDDLNNNLQKKYEDIKGEGLR